MKTNRINRLFLLLLLAFLNVLSGQAFSYSSTVLDLNPRNSDYLQEDQNTHAVVFEETSYVNSLQVTPDDSNGGKQASGRYFDNKQFFEPALKHKNSSKHLQDKRKILEHQIFPFHFFW